MRFAPLLGALALAIQSDDACDTDQQLLDQHDEEKYDEQAELDEQSLVEQSLDQHDDEEYDEEYDEEPAELESLVEENLEEGPSTRCCAEKPPDKKCSELGGKTFYWQVTDPVLAQRLREGPESMKHTAQKGDTAEERAQRLYVKELSAKLAKDGLEATTVHADLVPVCCDTGARNFGKKLAQGMVNARRGFGKWMAGDMARQDVSTFINKCKVWGDTYKPVPLDQLWQWAPVSAKDLAKWGDDGKLPCVYKCGPGTCKKAGKAIKDEENSPLGRDGDGSGCAEDQAAKKEVQKTCQPDPEQCPKKEELFCQDADQAPCTRKGKKGCKKGAWTSITCTKECAHGVLCAAPAEEQVAVGGGSRPSLKRAGMAVLAALPAGWTEARNETTGQTYFYHKDGTTQWEHPAAPPPPPPQRPAAPKRSSSLPLPASPSGSDSPPRAARRNSAPGRGKGTAHRFSGALGE